MAHKLANLSQVCRQLNSNKMAGVKIAADIVKQTERIDIAGNVIDPMTKKIIKKVEEPYVPPQIQPKVESPMGNKIEQLIEAKINALVEKKIEEVLSKLI